MEGTEIGGVEIEVVDLAGSKDRAESGGVQADGLLEGGGVEVVELVFSFVAHWDWLSTVDY